MAQLLRTKRQTVTGDSSGQSELLDVSGIKGNIISVSIMPESGSAEIQGRSGDEWLGIPASGLELNIDIDQNQSNRLPRLRNTDSSGCVLAIYYKVYVRE